MLLALPNTTIGYHKNRPTVNILHRSDRVEVTNAIQNELDSLSQLFWFPRGAFSGSLLNHRLVDARECSNSIEGLKADICELLSGRNSISFFE